MNKIILFPVFLFIAGCGYLGNSDHLIAHATNPTFTNLKTTVFTAKCVRCHSGQSPSGDYDLSTYEGIMSEGRVVPGNPSASMLVQRLRDGSMPPSGPLSDQEIVTVEDWIRAGAKPEGGSSNVAPVANAGDDQKINLPVANFSIMGSATDADGKVVSYSWKKVSGPSVVLAGENTQVLTLNKISAGTYVFELTVTDDKGATASDDVTVVATSVSPTPTPKPTATPVPTPKPSPTPTPKPTATPQPTPTPSTAATFTFIETNILTPRCVQCHGSMKTYSGTMRYVNAGNSGSSKLFKETNSGGMPKGSSRLSAAQITAIKTWIDAGALNN